jgi:membrane protease subunit (stomatin/prohibitin family)
MEKAAEKGGDAASGMGMGLGAGMGMMMPGMISQAMQDSKNQGSASAGEAGKTKKCPACQKDAPLAAKFCPDCGVEFPKKAFCSNCGAALKKGAKFCPDCGLKIS